MALVPVIELLNVSLAFPDKVSVKALVKQEMFTLFKDLNLQIYEGEICVLIGPSGSGKSSLLKIMATLIPITAGELRLQDTASYTSQVGMLFQKNALFDSMTALENVVFPLKERELMNETEAIEKSEQLLEAVGLLEHKNKFPSEISGGMQKRLGLARALALDPKVIFYDDPTAGLDPITSRQITDLILRLQKEQNSTVVAVTNDMGRVFQMKARLIYVAHDGIIDCGHVEKLEDIQNSTVKEFVRGTHTGLS